MYYNSLISFKELLEDYMDNLFSVYEHELELMLANYNVLTRENNNIESSTAIGYILEEFIISKLHTFTEHKKNAKFIVYPAETAHKSYDCFAEFNGIRFLINIKSTKDTNNAVAAINKLKMDYCDDDTLKSFIILKVYYGFVKEGAKRKIKILQYDTFAIEEVDFSGGHVQDHRSWSKENKLNSGRLQISTKFREDNPMPIDLVSFAVTKKQILNMVDKNNDEDNE